MADENLSPAKELEELNKEEALPVAAVLTKKKGEDSDTSPLTNSQDNSTKGSKRKAHSS